MTPLGGQVLSRTRAEPAAAYPANPSPFIRLLAILARLMPGDYLRTFVYLNLIEGPRRLLRQGLTTFYRMDHIYAVLREFSGYYHGKFSILEFGTSDGYSFTKMLFATRYLKLEDRVVVHGFDSFEGMPPAADGRDRNIVDGVDWVEGEYRGRYADLVAYCDRHYRNHRIHRGYFENSLTPEVLESLREHRPILVWIDCDYYSSARTVMERLLPYLPNGCVIYFDEADALNFGSRFTGEMRLIHEINHGLLGDDVELIPDLKLSLDSKRVYRFVRFNSELRFDPVERDCAAHFVHHRTNDSPLP
jgi:hypothetical protein